MKLSKFSRVLLSALTVFAACAVTFMTTYTVMNVRGKREVAKAVESCQEALKNNADPLSGDETLAYMQAVVDSYYYGTPGEWTGEDGLDQVYRSYIASLGDDYAAYYSPEEYAAYREEAAGNKVGIGVQVRYDMEAKNLQVLLTVPDSPAEAAGVLPEDRILAVNGKRLSEVGFDAAVSEISGEIGTQVILTILRDGNELEIPVTRDRFTNVSVYFSVCSDGKTGLIRILNFDGATPDQFKAAVDGLISQGVTALVFDVRNNGGGSLDSVLSVLSYLIEKDQVLIHILDKDGGDDSRVSDDEHTVDLPMAVLTNGNTASAAELFTSCLRELKNATLVGEKTFGKGCMQSFFNLPNGGGMKLTFRMYNPPSNVSYHGIGISPDVAVELEDDSLPILLMTEEQDNQLTAAIAACRKS